MRPINFLYILLSLCTVQEHTLDKLKQQMQILKLSAQNSIKELMRLQIGLENTTARKLTDNKLTILKEMNNLVNSSLKEIRLTVNATNSQGKAAEICYENVDSTFKDITRNNSIKLDTCEKNALEIIVPTIRTINSGSHFGQTITYEYDQIYLLCYNESTKQHANCINEKLTGTHTKMNSLKNTIVLIKRRDKMAAITAYNNGKNCFANVQKNASSATGDVMMTASKCIKNVK